MSAPTLHRALTDPALSGNDFRVLAFLYTFLIPEHPRLVLRTYVAQNVHVRRDTVSDSIDRLAMHGYLVHCPRSDQQSRYSLPAGVRWNAA